MADQAVYHQGNQGVFVGGRLWTLLPPPAVFKNLGLEVLRLFRRCTHTYIYIYIAKQGHIILQPICERDFWLVDMGAMLYCQIVRIANSII